MRSENIQKMNALFNDQRVQNLLHEDFLHCLDWRDGLPDGLNRSVWRWLVDREIDAECVGSFLRFAHVPDRFHFAMMWRGGSAAEVLTA